MATTPAQIDLCRREPSEHQRLEFKEARSTYDFAKLTGYCVAIGNEGGGILLFGIHDKIPRPVVGTSAFENVNKVAADLFNNLGFRIDVEEVQHPDGRVLVFHIPSRPRGTAWHLKGAYLMRSVDGLTPMSEDRLRTIFAEGQPDWLEEATLGELAAEKVVELLDCQTFFELLDQPYPTSQAAVLARLTQNRLVDLTPKGYSIRRIAGLLLAKRLDQFPELQRKAARVVIYAGNSKLETRLDQTVGRGYAVGFQRLVDLVMAQLPQNEVIESALRKQVKLLPEKPIRELLANALIHQDLSITGMSPVIEIYDNRAEFSNPGRPIVPVEHFIDGYQSRNERVADLMRQMGICEEKSSGIDRVVSACELYQLPAPYFFARQDRTVITVYGPKNFDDMDRDARIRACYQHCTLKWVISERMTNQSLRERFGLPASKQAIVSQVITATIDAGSIKPDETAGDSRRYARYIPFWA